MPGPAPNTGSSTPRTVIPKLVINPVASLQPWPLTVTAVGETFTIPALPAVAWLDVFMDDSATLADIFPGLAEGDARDVILQAALNELYGPAEERELVWSIVDMAAGRPWWVAIRLINIAKQSWDYIGGEMVIRGIDATKLSLAAWLDATFHIILRGMDQKDHTRFLLQLEMVPAEVAAEQPEPEITADAFMSMMS